MKKYVYMFSEGNEMMRDLLGGKGANLAAMVNLGLPVPQGFTVTTEACNEYYADGKIINDEMKKQIDDCLERLEKLADKKLGGLDNPLLVSVRSGAKFSMPGMMDTILNLGLNDETVEVVAKQTGNRRFAFDSYRRFIQMYSDVVCEVDKELFEAKLSELKTSKGYESDLDITAEDFENIIIPQYKEIFKIKIESEKDQISLLDQKYIKTDFEKAKRVEDSIKKNISKEFYYDIKIAFKSDYKNKDTIIARLIKLAFIKGEKITKSTNKYAIAFNKMVKNYSREAHTFKGLLRFKEIQEGFLFAKYESHNDILEDLSRHFLQRMPKEKFVIYDKNRNKAFVSIYGNFEVVEILNLDIKESKKEEFFQNLWIGFYDAIAIKERKNKN